MKHPILDCSIPIDEGIEAHKEKLESDLSEKKEELTICLLSGLGAYSTEYVAELVVDIEILEKYLKKPGTQI